MSKHVSEQRRTEVTQKISAKLAVLDKYVSSGESDFSIPVKFSFNWFCSFSDNGLFVVSKSASDLRRGAELRLRVDQALVRCSEKLCDLSVDKRDERIRVLEKELLQFKEKCAELQKLLAGQAADNADLIIEVGALKARLKVKQAQWSEQSKVRELR